MRINSQNFSKVNFTSVLSTEIHLNQTKITDPENMEKVMSATLKFLKEPIINNSPTKLQEQFFTYVKDLNKKNNSLTKIIEGKLSYFITGKDAQDFINLGRDLGIARAKAKSNLETDIKTANTLSDKYAATINSFCTSLNLRVREFFKPGDEAGTIEYEGREMKLIIYAFQDTKGKISINDLKFDPVPYPVSIDQSITEGISRTKQKLEFGVKPEKVPQTKAEKKAAQKERKEQKDLKNMREFITFRSQCELF